MTDTLPDRDREIREARLRGIQESHEWYGMLSIENAQAVRDRIAKMLDGRRYTFVAVNTVQPHSRTDVRTGQRLKESEESPKLVFSDLDDGRRMAHIICGDTYGVWGLDSVYPTEREAWAARDEGKDATYLVLTGHGDTGTAHIMIEKRNGYNEMLRWDIVTEYVSSDERAEQEVEILEAVRRKLLAGWQQPEGRYSWEKDKPRPQFEPVSVKDETIAALDDMLHFVAEYERSILES